MVYCDSRAHFHLPRKKMLFYRKIDGGHINKVRVEVLWDVLLLFFLGRYFPLFKSTNEVNCQAELTQLVPF